MPREKQAAAPSSEMLQVKRVVSFLSLEEYKDSTDHLSKTLHRGYRLRIWRFYWSPLAPSTIL